MLSISYISIFFIKLTAQFEDRHNHVIIAQINVALKLCIIMQNINICLISVAGT